MFHPREKEDPPHSRGPPKTFRKISIDKKGHIQSLFNKRKAQVNEILVQSIFKFFPIII